MGTTFIVLGNVVFHSPNKTSVLNMSLLCFYCAFLCTICLKQVRLFKNVQIIISNIHLFSMLLNMNI